MSDENEALERKPLAIAASLVAGGKAEGIIPKTFDDCYRMAKLLSMSGLVPEHFRDKPEAACVAILQGLEVGLAPMAALQSIAVINGRPALWGDGALAVVRASGAMEWIKEWTEETTAFCEIKRKGEAGAILRSFSDADAKTAGLLNKKGPWQEYRSRMRQMRARSWAMRDGFADVLKGLYIAEEAADIPMRDITPAPAPAKIARKSSAEGKRDGSVRRFNEIRADIAKSEGPIECMEIWKSSREELAAMPRAWFEESLSPEFIDKMEEHGIKLDVDEYSWPILPPEEEAAA